MFRHDGLVDELYESRFLTVKTDYEVARADQLLKGRMTKQELVDANESGPGPGPQDTCRLQTATDNHIGFACEKLNEFQSTHAFRAHFSLWPFSSKYPE